MIQKTQRKSAKILETGNAVSEIPGNWKLKIFAIFENPGTWKWNFCIFAVFPGSWK